MSPKLPNSFCKLIINSHQIVSHLPRFFRDFINGIYIKKFIIGKIETDTYSANCFDFLPFHREFPNFPRQQFGQFFGNRSIEDSLIGLGHRTNIPKKFMNHRFFPMIHHIIRSQAKSMKSILALILQRKLNGQIVDTSRQIGRLKTHILHLFTSYPFE